MSLPPVLRWLDDLRSAPLPFAGLSVPGSRSVLDDALDALSERALVDALARPGRPFRRATLVAARTVSTAPLEWVAVLLARGTQVTWKAPAAAPGLAPLATALAARHDLPLRWTVDRSATAEAELVVAMGSDDMVSALTESPRPGQTVLAFGHRFSAAWVGRRDTPQAWDGVARDVAMHDTRGCLSPLVVFTDQPNALDQLAAAMERAQTRWPRGEVGPAEAATARARTALAIVTGAARTSDAWAVWDLPAAVWRPEALPRCVALRRVDGVADAAAEIAPWKSWLSCVATTQEHAGTFEALGARTALHGDLQRPPLDRLHDGVDWLSSTIRAPA